jgi:hypothetical protein
MTPMHKLKHAILALDAKFSDAELKPDLTADEIDALYEGLVERDEHWDSMNEVRGSGEETGLPCQWSRHYESKAVAAKMPDGSWVGWTYWYGGGKHGEPEAIDWMNEAYDLECQGEEKLVVVRTFSKLALSDTTKDATAPTAST